MAATQIDQFTQALFGKVESVIIVCAILILVVGIPLYWLRLKAERGLIRVIRSSREKRETHNSTSDTNASKTVPHCPICNALMVKRLARRGASAGSSFCISLAPARLDRYPCGLTGHVAHPGRSIGVAAIIPSVEARERFNPINYEPITFGLIPIRPMQLTPCITARVALRDWFSGR